MRISNHLALFCTWLTRRLLGFFSSLSSGEFEISIMHLMPKISARKQSQWSSNCLSWPVVEKIFMTANYGIPGDKCSLRSRNYRICTSKLQDLYFCKELIQAILHPEGTIRLNFLKLNPLTLSNRMAATRLPEGSSPWAVLLFVLCSGAVHSWKSMKSALESTNW